MFIYVLGSHEKHKKTISLLFDSTSNHFLPLGYLLNKYCENSRVWLINSQGLPGYLQSQILPGHIVISVCPDMPESKVTVAWNKNKSGCHIKIGGAFPFEDYHLAVDGYLIELSHSEVTIGRGAVTLPLGRAIASEYTQEALQEILDQIEAVVARVDDLDDKLSPILWLTKDHFWSVYVPKMASLCETVVDVVDLLDKVRDVAMQHWDSHDVENFNATSRAVLDEFRQRGTTQDKEARSEIIRLSTSYHWLDGVRPRD